MLEKFEKFEIENPQVIYGGYWGRPHGDDAGTPPDNF